MYGDLGVKIWKFLKWRFYWENEWRFLIMTSCRDGMMVRIGGMPRRQGGCTLGASEQLFSRWWIIVIQSDIMGTYGNTVEIDHQPDRRCRFVWTWWENLPHRSCDKICDFQWNLSLWVKFFQPGSHWSTVSPDVWSPNLTILGGELPTARKWVSSPQWFPWDKERVNPLITGVITHLLSGMSHQVAVSCSSHCFPISIPLHPCSEQHDPTSLNRFKYGSSFMTKNPWFLVQTFIAWGLFRIIPGKFTCFVTSVCPPTWWLIPRLVSGL